MFTACPVTSGCASVNDTNTMRSEDTPHSTRTPREPIDQSGRHDIKQRLQHAQCTALPPRAAGHARHTAPTSREALTGGNVHYSDLNAGGNDGEVAGRVRGGAGPLQHIPGQRRGRLHEIPSIRHSLHCLKPVRHRQTGQNHSQTRKNCACRGRHDVPKFRPDSPH